MVGAGVDVATAVVRGGAVPTEEEAPQPASIAASATEVPAPRSQDCIILAGELTATTLPSLLQPEGGPPECKRLERRPLAKFKLRFARQPG